MQPCPRTFDPRSGASRTAKCETGFPRHATFGEQLGISRTVVLPASAPAARGRFCAGPWRFRNLCVPKDWAEAWLRERRTAKLLLSHLRKLTLIELLGLTNLYIFSCCIWALLVYARGPFRLSIGPRFAFCGPLRSSGPASLTPYRIPREISDGLPNRFKERSKNEQNKQSK